MGFMDQFKPKTGQLPSDILGAARSIVGHTDPVSAIRDIMATADGETRMRIRKELGM